MTFFSLSSNIAVKYQSLHIFTTLNLSGQEIQVRNITMWSGLMSKIERKIEKDEEIQTQLKKFKQRKTVKAIKKASNLVTKGINESKKIILTPIQFASKQSLKIINIPIDFISTRIKIAREKNSLLIRVPLALTNMTSKVIFHNPISTSVSKLFVLISQDLDREQQQIFGNNYSQDVVVKEKTGGLMKIPQPTGIWIKNNIFYKLEKSEKIYSKLIKYFIRIPSEMRAVIRKSSRFILRENDIAVSLKYIRKYHPNFRIEVFMDQFESQILPRFINHFLDYNLVPIKDLLSERGKNIVKSFIESEKKSGKILQKKIMDFRNLEFYSATMENKQPLLTFIFTADEIHKMKTKNQKNSQNSDSKYFVLNATYIISLILDEQDLKWKVYDFLQQRVYLWD
ncbi:import inner membrane translocase subunit tim44 [Anaeramoeba ignava]|uniref:Import inner membrane translocase subunit tim44 n=1 Tax=Anaeramoeba ignava TaxID=1746090 RepID=A0A9Q0LF28_ANAIG|nr:import inner membrane translocase subunit tim44 [Anaeramoeba ignava]